MKAFSLIPMLSIVGRRDREGREVVQVSNFYAQG